MQMQQLNTEGWAKTYLIWDDESKEAAIIDPVYDFTNSYLATIEQLDLILTMCIATHTHADGQAVPIQDPFSVGGYLMMHPGSQTASIKETVNCRCTMIFTNNPSEQGLLQFGLDRSEIANLRDSEALQRVLSV